MQQTEAVVIGAGPAGLATAACLQRAGVPFEQIEQASRLGDSWRAHYDRLHLHTPRFTSGLPYLKMPKSFPRYPARDDVVSYLEDYGQHFSLRPRLGERVERVRRDSGGWITHTDKSEYRSQTVVIATGLTRVPHEPSWPGVEQFPQRIVHSSQYRNGAAYKGKRVLVVGFGNSACEIAICLHEHGAKPAISVRSGVNVVPRDAFGLPILGVGITLASLPPRLADVLSWPIIRLSLGDIRRVGLPKHQLGTFEMLAKEQKNPVLDIGTLDLIRGGNLELFPGIDRFQGSEVVFEDGRREQFDAIVLGTGYRSKVGEFLEADGALGPDGTPRTSGGPSELPGLYFCGFHYGPIGLLREVSQEARRIANHIARRSIKARR